MERVIEKYRTDPEFQRLVDTILSHIIECKFTPSEIRQAGILASIKYEEMAVRKEFVIANNEEFDKAINDLYKFLDKEK